MDHEPDQLRISPMAKTWILDLDGTLVVHDGPFIMGKDEFLPGAREFLESIPKRDMIILLTARSDYEKAHTLRFLRENNVRYDHIIFNAGESERIMINDMKPDGLVTAYCSGAPSVLNPELIRHQYKAGSILPNGVCD